MPGPRQSARGSVRPEAEAHQALASGSTGEDREGRDAHRDRPEPQRLAYDD